MPAAHFTPFDPLDYAQRLKAANIPEAQAEAQARALRDAFAVQAQAIERAAQLAHEAGAKAQDAVRELDTKNGRAVLELKAEIAKTQAEIVKTQQAILELKAHVDVRHAETQGQFKLLHWMFTALFGVCVAIALKLFL